MDGQDAELIESYQIQDEEGNTKGPFTFSEVLRRYKLNMLSPNSRLIVNGGDSSITTEEFGKLVNTFLPTSPVTVDGPETSSLNMSATSTLSTSFSSSNPRRVEFDSSRDDSLLVGDLSSLDRQSEDGDTEERGKGAEKERTTLDRREMDLLKQMYFDAEDSARKTKKELQEMTQKMQEMEEERAEREKQTKEREDDYEEERREREKQKKEMEGERRGLEKQIQEAEVAMEEGMLRANVLQQQMEKIRQTTTKQREEGEKKLEEMKREIESTRGEVEREKTIRIANEKAAEEWSMKYNTLDAKYRCESRRLREEIETIKEDAEKEREKRNGAKSGTVEEMQRELKELREMLDNERSMGAAKEGMMNEWELKFNAIQQVAINYKDKLEKLESTQRKESGEGEKMNEGTVEEVQKEVEEAREELENEKEIEEHKDKMLEDLERKLASVRGVALKYKKEVQQLNQQIADLRQQITPEKEELMKNLKEKENTVEELKEILKVKENTVEELKKVLTEKESTVEELNKILKEKDSTVEELKKELDTVRRRGREEGEVTEMCEQIEEIKGQLENIQETARREKEKDRKEVDNLNRQIERMNKQKKNEEEKWERIQRERRLIENGMEKMRLVMFPHHGEEKVRKEMTDNHLLVSWLGTARKKLEDTMKENAEMKRYLGGNQKNYTVDKQKTTVDKQKSTVDKQKSTVDNGQKNRPIGGHDDDSGEGVRKEIRRMRKTLERNEEGLDSLRKMLRGEDSVGDTDLHTLSGLLQKTKSLEELCLAKDAIIDAHKKQAVISEYELAQLRCVVKLDKKCEEAKEKGTVGTEKHVSPSPAPLLTTVAPVPSTAETTTSSASLGTSSKNTEPTASSTVSVPSTQFQWDTSKQRCVFKEAASAIKSQSADHPLRFSFKSPPNNSATPAPVGPNAIAQNTQSTVASSKSTVTSSTTPSTPTATFSLPTTSQPIFGGPSFLRTATGSVLVSSSIPSRFGASSAFSMTGSPLQSPKLVVPPKNLTWRTTTVDGEPATGFLEGVSTFFSTVPADDPLLPLKMKSRARVRKRPAAPSDTVDVPQGTKLFKDAQYTTIFKAPVDPPQPQSASTSSAVPTDPQVESKEVEEVDKE